MSNVTIVGNLAGDPELAYTASGVAVAKFTVMENRRYKDKGGDWQDGEPTPWPCKVWRDAAENVAESLARGTRVIVTGTTETEAWEKNGEKRTRLVVNVDEVGPSLRYATTKVNKTSRGGGSPAGGQSSNWDGYGQPQQSSLPDDDPWATKG